MDLLFCQTTDLSRLDTHASRRPDSVGKPFDFCIQLPLAQGGERSSFLSVPCAGIPCGKPLRQGREKATVSYVTVSQSHFSLRQR